MLLHLYCYLLKFFQTFLMQFAQIEVAQLDYLQLMHQYHVRPCLNNLDKITSEGNINLHIPEIASVILPIRPNPFFFLSKEFPEIKFNHRSQGFRKRDNEVNKEDNKSLNHENRSFQKQRNP